MKQLAGLTGAADYQQRIDQFIWLIPSMQAVAAFTTLGPDGETRKSNDPQLVVTRAAVAANVNLFRAMNDDGCAYGVVSKLSNNFVDALQQTGEVHQIMVVAVASDADTNLIPVSRTLGPDGLTHHLDALSSDGDVTVFDLVEHCKETVFKVDPLPFHAALDGANKALGTANTFTDVFGFDMPAVCLALQNSIRIPTATRTEMITCAIFSENIDKPLKQKRAVRSHFSNTPCEIWSLQHKYILTLTDPMTAGLEPVRKAAKGSEMSF
jgi:hypothetical protein